MSAPAGSHDRFGYSWERFHRLTKEQEQQFYGWVAALPADAWQGSHFLDAGCGSGRNSVYAMGMGAVSGVSIDLDERTLEAARKNLAEFSSIRVKKQDLFLLQDREVYDIVFSIGVIHHTEEPQKAIHILANALKPGGRLLIWVYGRENLGLYLAILDPLRRVVFSRMPLNLLRLLAHVPSGILWVMTRMGSSRISYLNQLRKFTYKHIHHIVFDQMLPRISIYYRQDEARALLEAAGLEDIRIFHVQDVSWSVSGMKPKK